MRSKFDYVRPQSIEEAVQMKARPGAVCWAGGTDLLLQWRRGEKDVKVCVDLSFIQKLKQIESSEEELTIGAMAPLAALEHLQCDELLASCITRTVRAMCTPQLRTYATVGGNLCNASPAADLSVLFVALGATARIAGKAGERTMALDEFFKGVNKTALAGDEILTAIQVPMPGQKLSPSFQRVGRTAVDIAQVNCAVCLACDSKGIVKTARVCLGAVAPTPIRSTAAENMLSGHEFKKIDPALIEKVADRVRADAKPIDDIRGTAAYRLHIIGVLAKRCVVESVQNLGRGKQ